MATENILIQGITLRGLEEHFHKMVGEQLLCSPSMLNDEPCYPTVDDMLSIAWEHHSLKSIDKALVHSIYYHLTLQETADQLPTFEEHRAQWGYAYRVAPKCMELIELCIWS